MNPIKSYEFIDAPLLKHLKSEVISLEDSWKPWSPHLQSHLPDKSKFMILGDTIYQLDKLSSIDLKLRDLMLEKFKFLYDILIDKIQNLSGIETGFRDDLPVPGFHISRLKSLPAERPYHVDDRIVAYSNNAKSIALLCLIDSNSNGAGLEYIEGDKELYFEYKKGYLHSWGPSLFHRIERNSLVTKENETRMTLQAHCYFDKDLNKNILFF